MANDRSVKAWNDAPLSHGAEAREAALPLCLFSFFLRWLDHDLPVVGEVDDFLRKSIAFSTVCCQIFAHSVDGIVLLLERNQLPLR